MPAAGSGRRFGAAVAKQYLPLAGRTVIEHSLAHFLNDPRCRQIIVAVDTADTQFAALPLARDPRVRQVGGGAQRCDSVWNALQVLQGGDADWVLVHDAARPCVTRQEIDSLIATLAPDAIGGLLAVALADTLKRGDRSQHVVDTSSRELLWRALTPQMFRLGLLRKALDEARRAGRQPTDESQAVEWIGHAPRLVEGRASNLKITTPDDLALATAILSREKAAS